MIILLNWENNIVFKQGLYVFANENNGHTYYKLDADDSKAKRSEVMDGQMKR